MLRIVFYISFLVQALDVFGQSAVGAEAKLLTRFNFRQFSGGIILLKAKLNTIPDTFNFILDTGSGAISLDSIHLRAL